MILHKRYYSFIPAVLVAVGIAVVSLLETTQIPNTHTDDKILHASVYAIWTVIFMGACIYSRYTRPLVYGLIFVVVNIYGTLMEVLQHFCTQTRSGSIADIMANMVGSVIGMVFLYFVYSLWQRKNTPTT